MSSYVRRRARRRNRAARMIYTPETEVEAFEAGFRAALSDTGDIRAATIEECAKVAEAADGQWVERTIPAHDERDDFGEVIMRHPERIQKFRRHPSGKSIATAIRALNQPGSER